MSGPSKPTRRVLLGGALATVAAGTFWLHHRALRPTAPGEAPRHLDARAWATLEAALDRLLPSADGLRGARDADAVAWIDGVLGDDGVEPDARERIREAARRLDAAARERGAASYAALPPAAQDAALAAFEDTWEDELILRTLLAFGLEALLREEAPA